MATMTQLNQPNGLHLSVRASVGGTRAGRSWIEVPTDGVPADLLPHVRMHLGTSEDRPSAGGYAVDAPTWESVRAEVERDVAENAKREADRIAKRASDTADWRKLAAAYLAGGAYSDALGYYGDATEEEQAAARAERTRRWQAEVDAKTALVESLIERIAGGEGTLDTYAPRWLEIDGKHIGWETNGIAPDLQERLSTIAKQRAEDAKRAKAEAEAIAIAERNTWIAAHGSGRLQKGLATGMIDKLGGAYLDERIAHDLGDDWINWQTADEPKSNDRLNPEESELDALAEARAKWPTANARLVSVGGRDDKLDADFDWRPALTLDCPWDLEETAIRYLD